MNSNTKGCRFLLLCQRDLSSQVEMASVVANLRPPLFVNGRQPLLRNLRKFVVSPLGERQRHVAVVAKAMGESPNSSTSLSIVKSVQNVEMNNVDAYKHTKADPKLLIDHYKHRFLWDKSEDRYALIGLGFAAVVALWAYANLITVISAIPFCRRTRRNVLSSG